ncbi:MAG TPA: cysteine--tRNA ligase [Terriglobales bacterium]|nr:cysteine--tRNA ligase [Terriglobales bacterium]
MALRIYNTLSGEVEAFRTLHPNEVRMYACGPTVYDYGHIGNFRTFVAVDILFRWLGLNGYKVRYVMNITDVDDKIIRNSTRDHVSVKEYTAKYEQAFLEDLKALHVRQPEFVHATDYIPQMVDFVGKLKEKGYAYRAEDGSYYFSIAKFNGYGKLSKKDFAGIEDGARVDVDEYEKDNARDFALWKAAKPEEASWDTSIGNGRPGWHLECSVMSISKLGESFDLHAGGEDLIFPHHENEIAQSESLTGKPFAQFWFHARFLLIEGEKMSKSQGNFYTLRDLVLKGHKPSSIRFLLASVPYRNQLNFTFDGLQAAAISVERLRNFRWRLTNTELATSAPSGAVTGQTMAALAKTSSERLHAAMDDDLNTAQAQAALLNMVRTANAALDAGQVSKEDVPALLRTLEEFDSIFDILRDDDVPLMKSVLEWAQRESGKESEISQELKTAVQSAGLSDSDVNQKLAEMEAARRSRNFSVSDAIRAELTAAGILVENTKEGFRWRRK